MKNIKGFTLIELLAVIIILGILSVVIVPKVINIISESEQKTNKASVYALEREAENFYTAKTGELTPFTGCVYDFTNNNNTCDEFEFKGEKPETGIINIDKSGEISIAIKYENTCYLKNFNDTEIITKDYNSYDCAIPQYNRWDGTSTEITPQGDTYYVYDSRQLAWISEQTNSGNSFEGKKVVLLNDINFGAEFDSSGNLIAGSAPKFTPIGLTEGNEFKGNFDGNNKKIYNLYINESNTTKVGLFARYYGTEFKNLTIENSYIKGNQQVGIIGSNGSNAPNLEINNIKSINNTIVAENICAGGIAGVIKGNIKNSYSDSKITGTSYLGGIVCGNLNGSIENSINNGPIIGNSHSAGGIVSYIDNSNIIGNTNNGHVTSNSYGVGGIVGYIEDNGGNIIGNINNGRVTGDVKWIGGIIGMNNTPDAQFVVISDNINNGEIKATNGAFRVGGIIANTNNGVLIYNNINRGSIDGLGSGTNQVYAIGGIIGTLGNDSMSENKKSYVYNNYNSGNVKGKGSVGGIVGNTYDESKPGECVNNSINEGTIESLTVGYAGGIIGRFYTNNTYYVSDFVTKAFNKGTIKGLNAAGLIGSNVGIKDSITIGNLEGTNNYGVIANAVAGVNISNVYYPDIYTSSYGTSFDKTTLDATMVQNTLGQAFSYSNGEVKLYKAEIESSGFEITSVSYTNEILN